MTTSPRCFPIKRQESERGAIERAQGGDGGRWGQRRAGACPGRCGIAIGAGTDVAIEAAGIVLVKNNSLDVVSVIEFAQVTNRKMVENLA